MLSSMIMPHWQIMEQHLDMGGLPKQRFSAKSSRLTSIGAHAQAKGLKPKHSKAVRHHAEISQYLLLFFSHHGEIIFLNHYDETINSHQFSHHSLEPTRTCNFTMFQILMQCRLEPVGTCTIFLNVIVKSRLPFLRIESSNFTMLCKQKFINISENAHNNQSSECSQATNLSG